MLIKRLFLILIIVLIQSESYSQKDTLKTSDDKANLDFNLPDTIEEINIMNLTRDTVFSFFWNGKSRNAYDSDKFNLKQGKVWSSYNSENKLIEKGQFKKWKPVRFYLIRLLFRPRFWSKAKRKIEHNGRHYLPKVKVGKWFYLDRNEQIIKTITFNRLGCVISKSHIN